MRALAHGLGPTVRSLLATIDARDAVAERARDLARFLDDDLRAVLDARDGEATLDAAKRMKAFLVRCTGVDWREGGAADVRFGGAAVGAIVEALADCFREAGGVNVVEMKATHADLGPLLVTIQRRDGKTPMDLRAEAEDRACALRDALAEIGRGTAGGDGREHCLAVFARQALDRADVPCPHLAENERLRAMLEARDEEDRT